MTRRILAFFASSFLTVAFTIPAMAQEVDGTIESIDPERAQLRLSDGETYDLPEHFDYSAVAPGMTVVLIYDQDEPTILRVI
ncbi:DUF1344 domain-containing protein [Aurantimonas sp. VKM B-3413]|uniref:DUF1344 domain-containing protein n=1 Tax=Aurantimonas sp. VKM B-3413 TaxID=2779401 RepID=UPI001E30434A|nr:DUF1344 domain-containing protein [Aurantimonas sp. VKM B-3413]